MIKFDLKCYRDGDLSRIFWDNFQDLYACKKFYWQGGGLCYLVIAEKESDFDEPFYCEDEIDKWNNARLEIELQEIGEHYEFLRWLEHFDDYDEDDAEQYHGRAVEYLMAIDRGDWYEKHFEHVAFADLTGQFVSTGYSQGDAVTVEIVGSLAVHWEELEKELSNLLWDSPLSCRVEVLQAEPCEFLSCAEWVTIDEIDLVEGLPDYYDYDREKLISYAEQVTKKDYYGAELVAYLEKNLPDYPEYRY